MSVASQIIRFCA